MKQFRLLFAVILLWVGVASSYAYDKYDRGTTVINGVTYHLYYFLANYFGETSHGAAYVEAFDGSYSEITIPESITDGGNSYKVEGFHYNPQLHSSTPTISSTTVRTIHIQCCPWFYPDEGNPTFACPNLQTIYFEGASPSFGGSYEDYFASPLKNNITVYVSDKTEDEIAALTSNASVWCDFENVSPISNATVKRNVNLSISNAKVEIGNNTFVRDGAMQVNMYSDLTLKVYQGYDVYHVESVKLNGMEILDGMTFTQGAADYLSYYTYTLPNITSDAYITVNGENSKYEVYAICSSGGTLDSPNSVAHPIDPNTKTAIRWLKADGNSSLTITPDAGYTLDNVYRNSEKVTDDVTQNNNGTYTYPLTGDGFISVVFKNAGENILFADPNVKAICVENWDTNHDGELSKAEAAAVTTLGTVFKNKADITSFDEFQYFTGLTAVEADAFYNASLTSIVLPNTITEIKLRAFYGTRLTSIQFPEGLTTIGEKAFYNAESLEYVKFPQSLTTIGYYAFHATALTHIFIPQNVTYIGDEVSNPFSGCKKLVSIVVDERNEVYDSRDNCNAIIHGWGTSKTANVIVGCQSTILPKNAQTETINLGMTSFNGLGLKKFVIPEHFGSFYQFALAENDLDSLIIKKKEAFDYNPIHYSFSSEPAQNMLNTVVVVPYGTKDAYVAKGWVGEGDEGTQVVKRVIEAAPELNAVIVPADGQYIKVFTGEDNILGFKNETFTCGMEKGGTYKIGIGKKPVSENHLYINGVKQTEYVDNEDGYLTYTVTNVTEDMLIEAKYADTEWFVPICTTPGGKTTIYYHKTDGSEPSIYTDPTEPSVFELYHIEPNTDIRFVIKPHEGYRLFLVFCGWERLIGADEEKEVKPLEDGSYEFTLPAYQITTGETTPVIIYQKIGEDVNYDLNGDGTVNVTDLTLLVNYILHH